MQRAIMGTRIRQQRREFGMTQSALAKQVGISASYLNLIEWNKRPIAGGLLRKIADALNLATDDLDGTVARWRSAGVEFVRIAWSEEDSGVAECPYGRFIAFQDPFGNVHELLQPRA